MYYVVSDIHSNYIAFSKVLKKLNNDDTLFIIGDILDRGKDGFRILDEIMKRENIRFIMGNHEAALLNVFLGIANEDEKQTNAWKRYWFDGGGENSYHYFFEELEVQKQTEYLNYLFDAPYCELVEVNGKYFYLVHACPSNDRLEQIADRNHIFGIISEKLDIVVNKETKEVKIKKITKKDKYNEDEFVVNPTIIVGHNPTKYIQDNDPCEIWKKNNFINIDCGSNGYYHLQKNKNEPVGRLACLCLNTMKVEYY